MKAFEQLDQPFFDELSLNTTQTDLLPQALLSAHPHTWTMSGEGVFSWTVFKLYRARLFVSGARYDVSQPFVLDLSYLRTLPAEMIVSASIDELKRLRQPAPEVMQSWSDTLHRIVPDVTLDDRLVGCFTPGQGVSFYSATALLGEISDPAFAEAFAAIWLDPETRSSSLRASFLGEGAVTLKEGI